jgi:hypothetical protein
MKLAKPGKDGASQVIFSARRTKREESRRRGESAMHGIAAVSILALCLVAPVSGADTQEDVAPAFRQWVADHADAFRGGA